MLGKLFDKVLHDDESDIGSSVKGDHLKVTSGHKQTGLSLKGLILPSAVFVLALASRVAVLFLTDPQTPGWYDDTFHHWQIGYLTKEVGLTHGFLRLWDFKGMEYFWGLAHPLILVLLFFITGSTSILIPRLVSIVASSLAIALVFTLLARWTNKTTAVAGALLMIFIPVTLYSDTVGMQEPLAMVFLLSAILVWPRRVFLSAFLLMFAGMVRAEYWLFSFGIFSAMVLSREKFDKKVVLLVSYFVANALYMKYLLDHTGNAIYPIYWNFLASVKGDWFANIPLSPGAVATQTIARWAFAAGLLGGIATFVKKPKSYLLLLFGFGNILFLGFVLGFGAYIRGYLPRFWIDRLFAWPYSFVGILLSVLLLYSLPNLFKSIRPVVKVIGFLVLMSALVLAQSEWSMINEYITQGKNRYASEKALAAQLGSYYKGGKVLIPEDRPPFVYYLVADQEIEGKNILGEMFDPFFYFKEDPYQKWGDYRETLVGWIKNEDIRLIMFYKGRERYEKLVEVEPQMFTYLGHAYGAIQFYAVNKI